MQQSFLFSFVLFVLVKQECISSLAYSCCFFKGKIKEHGGSILSSFLVLCGVSLYFDTHEYTKGATEFEGSITEILIAE